MARYLVVPRVNCHLDDGRALAADVNHAILGRHLAEGRQGDRLLHDISELQEQLVLPLQVREVHVVCTQRQEDRVAQVRCRCSRGGRWRLVDRKHLAHFDSESSDEDLTDARHARQQNGQVAFYKLVPVLERLLDGGHELVLRRQDPSNDPTIRDVVFQSDVLSLARHGIRCLQCYQGPHDSLEGRQDRGLPQHRLQVDAAEGNSHVHLQARRQCGSARSCRCQSRAR